LEEGFKRGLDFPREGKLFFFIPQKGLWGEIIRGLNFWEFPKLPKFLKGGGYWRPLGGLKKGFLN